MYMIVPGSFGSPIPRELRDISVLLCSGGAQLARSLVVGCPRHHRVGSTAWSVTFMSAIRRAFAGAANA